MADGTPVPVAVGVSRENPPALYWARPAGERVYLTKAMPAGVGLPMVVMSITCGDPCFVPVLIVMPALAYCAASAVQHRLICGCSLIAWVMNALAASSWPDCSVESSEVSAKI